MCYMTMSWKAGDEISMNFDEYATCLATVLSIPFVVHEFVLVTADDRGGFSYK